MPSSSDSDSDFDLGISAYSRHRLPNEEAELAAFVAAVIDADLQMFVEEAFYDSNSNCCTFTYRFGLAAHDDEAVRLYAIALLTISQFEWFGINCHGRWISDD